MSNSANFIKTESAWCEIYRWGFLSIRTLEKAYPNHLIWAGFDEMMVPAVSLGVDGAIGSTFNVNGVRARQIFELTKQGKLADALQVSTRD